jgi:hypothetical protein
MFGPSLTFQKPEPGPQALACYSWRSVVKIDEFNLFSACDQFFSSIHQFEIHLPASWKVFFQKSVRFLDTRTVGSSISLFHMRESVFIGMIWMEILPKYDKYMILPPICSCDIIFSFVTPPKKMPTGPAWDFCRPKPGISGQAGPTHH